MDVTNGEVLAMASLPTYDANKAKTITNEALFNRATLGVYEQGSTFKIFNTAMALDSGKVTMSSMFDATSPIKIDRFTINDDHAQHRAADRAGDLHLLLEHRLGQDGGRGDGAGGARRAFFDKIGFLKPLTTELPELAGRCGRATGSRSTP